MPHDAGVGQQGGDLLFTEARHLGRIEIREAAPERLALVQDGAPTEARLEPFQAKLFEQGAVIALRTAPFVVVIGHVFGGRIHPAAAGQAVGKFGFSVQGIAPGGNQATDATAATSPKKVVAAAVRIPLLFAPQIPRQPCPRAPPCPC
ncbi:hypothetical protein G6F68_017186 [Rhizopus microsporus]|nr:hypothetical protein G6F68_017186 [Rhizopus microsporus]